MRAVALAYRRERRAGQSALRSMGDVRANRHDGTWCFESCHVGDPAAGETAVAIGSAPAGRSN